MSKILFVGNHINHEEISISLATRGYEIIRLSYFDFNLRPQNGKFHAAVIYSISTIGTSKIIKKTIEKARDETKGKVLLIHPYNKESEEEKFYRRIIGDIPIDFIQSQNGLENLAELL